MRKNFFIDRIVSFKDNDVYVAVSLEFDIVAEGDSAEEAIDRLRDATMGYLLVCVEEKEPEENIFRRAPEEYQKMWNYVYEVIGFVPPKTEKGSIKSKQNKIQKNEVLIRTESYEPSLA